MKFKITKRFSDGVVRTETSKMEFPVGFRAQSSLYAWNYEVVACVQVGK